MNMLVLPHTSGIYRILNTVNGKYYIGSATRMDARQSTHLSALRRDKHPNIKLQNAWKKYGKDAFVFEVVELVEDKSQLISYEQKWIDTLKPQYNIAPKAGSRLGCKQLPSLVKKPLHPALIAQQQKGVPGHPVTEKTKKQIAAKLQKHTVSEVTRTRISTSKKGHKLGPMPVEHKINHSFAGMGKNKGKPSPFRGKRASKATRLKQSLVRTGKPSPKKGIPMSENQKKKVSIAKKTINLLRKGLPVSPQDWTQGELWDIA